MCDLIEALASSLSDLSTSATTLPPQVEYNKIVVSALEKMHFFEFVSKTLTELHGYDREVFAFCTVRSRLGAIVHPSQEDFQQYKGFYMFNSVLNSTVADVFQTELIRGIRLFVSQLIFRFFKTYDVTDCDPQRATFRMKNHSVTSVQFTEFLELLLVTSNYLSQFSQSLAEFATPFKNAATVAKKMRADFKVTQQKERTATLTKTFAQPQQEQQSQTQKPVQFVPAPIPKKNAWNECKQQHVEVPRQTETLPAEASQAAPQALQTNPLEQGSDVQEDQDVSVDDFIKVVKRQHARRQGDNKRSNVRFQQK